MTSYNIKALLDCDIKKVWHLVTDVDGYNWRSDLDYTKIVDEFQFIEYDYNNFPTYFKITNIKEY